MTYFLLSLLALAAAPPLELVVRKLGNKFVLIERFCFLLVAILVVGHILPESYQSSGWWAVLMLAIGLLLPTVMERALHHEKMHTAIIGLVTFGLALHGIMDGAALGLSYQMGADISSILPVAVVIHRIPAALFLWWVLRPRGVFYGWGVLVLLAVATCFGFFFATGEVISLRDEFTLGLFQALVGGSLVHLAVHRPEDHDH